MPIFSLTRKQSFDQLTNGIDDSSMQKMVASLSDTRIVGKSKYAKITRSEIDPKNENSSTFQVSKYKWISITY